MKRYLILWLSGCVMLCWTASAQQIPVSTIFVENPFVFNPAVCASGNAFQIRLNTRLQWLGFDDSPVTNHLSAYGPHKVRNIGYGANIVSDQTGPINNLKLNGAFASNFAVTGDIRASFGMSVGLIQYRADGTQFVFDDDEEDLRAPHAVMSSFQPDAGVGVYVYHVDWYLGLSAQQLFNNNLKFTAEGEDSKRNRLKTHLYALAGYRFMDVNKHWIIEPSFLFRKVAALPFQMDFSGRVIYREQFWGGLSARNTFASFDDLSLVMGYIHEQKIRISLAYDFSFAKIRKYTNGTIELVFGYDFDKIRSR